MRAPATDAGAAAETRSPDHRRRHRRLQIARADPPAEGARARRALHPHRGGAGIRHAAVGRRALRANARSPICSMPATEFDVGHIRLARETDLVVVAPATADLMAKMANGHADDLASTVLLATDRAVLVAPAMNPHMWQHPATRRNLARLADDGVAIVGPNTGEMAEAGEAGVGRMAEPLEIAASSWNHCSPTRATTRALAGKRVIVTSGPTHEPIDPVRYIANRSSGKQGHAIAAAAAAAGADVTLVSGPVDVPDPAGVKIVKVATARDMLAAVTKALPADVAVFAAAVADWRVDKPNANKIKKRPGASPKLDLVENPDILATVAHDARARPRLVIGFAAETDHIVEHAKAKLARKGCDWIVANDVSVATGVMGGDRNTVHLVTGQGRGNPGRRNRNRKWRARSSPALPRRLPERRGEQNRSPDHAAAPRRRPAAPRLSERARGRTRPRGCSAGWRAPDPRAGSARGNPHRHRDRDTSRRRRADQAAVRPCTSAWRDRAQLSRDRRCRLSRRSTCNSCQFRPRPISGGARRTDCAVGSRGYIASRYLRSCKS